MTGRGALTERVLIFDFDGTVADTFTSSPGNISTFSAYERAVKDVFGEADLARYRRLGGLKNRSPTQVVMDLGVPANQINAATDELVRRKLNYLIPEIGKPTADGEPWPKLTPGFVQFWVAIQKLADRGAIKFANVSSGHTEFVKRTFEVHHLELPPVMISDDDLRQNQDIPPERRNKPDPLMLEMAAEKLGISNLGEAIYFGDDVVKDGWMAHHAGASFIHFDADIGNKLEYEEVPEIVVFHAGTKREKDQLVTAGGRVAAVTATGTDLREAREKAYAAAKSIYFEGMQYRTDIGNKGLQGFID